MPTVTLNIILATLSIVATFSAFGGRTWLENDKPLIKRITLRGYISLICLIAAFIIGIVKEINNNRIIDNKNTSIANLNSQLDHIRGQLAGSERVLNDILDMSQYQDQRRMNEIATATGRRPWKAPAYVYPGSIVKLYSLQRDASGLRGVKYGNREFGYTTVYIEPDWIRNGSYEFPVAGRSGVKFELYILGNWYGKVYVFSTPRSRSAEHSWETDRID